MSDRHIARRLFVVSLAVALSLATPLGASAQTGALLEGTIRDQNGAPLPGVAVELSADATATVRNATTSALGAYRFAGIEPGLRYVLIARLAGFSDQRIVVSDVAAADRRIVDFVLPVAGLNEMVSVTLDEHVVSSGPTTLGGMLLQEQVERVPVNGNDLVNLAYLLPGAAPARGFYNLAPRLTINGASSLVTNYTVDGFDNTDLFLGGPKVPVPVGATQNLNVLANAYSVEYGRTGNGVFSITTRSGSNQTTGDAFVQVRPGAIVDAPNYFAPRNASGDVIEDSFERQQLGASLGGALRQDRIFGFVSGEATRERQDAILTSPLAKGLAPTAFDQLAGVGRLDLRTRDANTLTLRYTFADYRHDKDIGFIGGLTLPSAGLVVDYANHFVSLNDRRIIRSSVLESGAMLGRLSANWQTPDGGPRVTVTDRGATLAVIGGLSDDFAWSETDVQARTVWTWLTGNHTLKAGGDLLTGRFDIQPGPGARGGYVIDLAGRPLTPAGGYLTLADIPRDVTVLSYSQSFINPRVRESQVLASAFVEDILRPHADLTLSLGVRWEYDSVTNTPIGDPDLDNVAPRVGLVWAPRGSVRDQVRASAGIFHERIPFAVYSDTIFNNPVGGALGATFAPGTAFVPPAFPQVFARDYFSQVPVAQLPPRNVQVFDPALQSPSTRQFSVGYQRQLPWNTTFGIDLVHARGVNLIRRVDTNAPTSIAAGTVRSVAAADATRPIVPVAGGLRLVERDESSGHSEFTGAYLTLRKRLSDRIAFDVAWTISRTENDTDDINFRPVDSRRPDDEWGPSLNDRLHVVAINGLVRLPWQLDLAPVLFLSSGQPLNVTTGTDDNGDTVFNDRPAGYTRNSERTSGYRQLDLGVMRSFRVRGTSITARADIFNVFDAVNYSGFFNFGASGVRPDEAGTLAFQPTVAGPARQVQFSLRVGFGR